MANVIAGGRFKMEKHLFYTPLAESGIVLLSEEESHHCSRVLRLQTGNRIELCDGKGGLFDAAITNIGKKQTEAEIISKTLHPPLFQGTVSIAVAPTKNLARYEWFVEKAVEIGISKIIPLQCENSERTHLRSERLEKILVSAAKQSRQFWFPSISEPIEFEKLLKLPSEKTKLIAWCPQSSDTGISTYFRAGNDVIVLIGPEGDFTEKEVSLALAHGFHSVSLGKSRLRTETAALAACHTIQFINSFLP